MTILKEFKDVEVVAVCDPIQAARDAAGEEFGVARRYASVEELLDAETLDAVFVAPPAHLNAQVALPCLEHGVNVMMEKPPGLSVAETTALRDAAARTSAKAMVGWNRRFHPLIREAREMVATRGPVTQLVGEFHKSLTRLAASGRHPEIILDNMLLETTIHSVDLLCALAGSDVKEVHSIVRRAASRFKDVYAALILFENGCVAQLVSNYTTDARLERYEIHGRGISAYLEGVSQGVVFCDGQKRELSGAGSGSTREQDRYFLDCVKDNRPVGLPAANLDEAVKTMQLAEAILAGIRE
jgi:virulence factor